MYKKSLRNYADWVFFKTGIPQEQTIQRVIEGFKIFREKCEKMKEDETTKKVRELLRKKYGLKGEFKPYE